MSPSRVAALLVCAALTASCGVTRTLHVDSSPPGARVYLDGRPAGTTPYTEVFLSYGVRRLELRREGHARNVREIDVARPWWQYFPFSFFSDLLWPVPLEDDHYVIVELTPAHESGGDFADAQNAFAGLKALKRLLAARDAAFHDHRPVPQGGAEEGLSVDSGSPDAAGEADPDAGQEPLSGP